MAEESIKHKRIFYLFIFCQFIFWTIIPTLFIKTIPMDSAESAAWGHEWQLGYWKHPPLSSWIANIAVDLQGGHPGILMYLIPQLCILLAFIAIWKLTKELMNSAYATISVLCLSGVYYYSFPSIMINPNIVGIPLWALLSLYIYKIAKKYSILNWLIIAVLAALSTLCKYEAAFLFIPAFIFLLVNKKTREQFLKPGFWIAAVVFIALLAPHIIWLFKNDFSPILYALDTANTPDVLQAILDHILNPIGYLINIVLTALPALILVYIFKFKNKEKESIEKNKLNTSFILLVALGAFISTFAVSLLVGTNVNPYWTITYYNFVGTACLYFLTPKIDKIRFKIFSLICLCAVIIPPIVTGLIISFLPPQINGRSTIVQYPAQRLADFCSKTWHENTNKPFKYVGCSGGDMYYVNCYLKERPHTFMLVDGEETPWSKKADLEKDGAFFFWLDIPRYSQVGEKIKENFNGKFIEVPAHDIPWLTDSIYNQFKNHQSAEKLILKLSKYLPFLNEKIAPLRIKGLILLPMEK